MGIFKKKKSGKPKDKKKIGQKVKEKLKGVGKKIGLVGKKAPYAYVLPFKGLMKKRLDAAHVAHDNTIEDIANKFVKNVIQKKNFDDVHSIVTDSEEQHFAVTALAAAGTIVSAILSFFENLKKRKAAAAKGEGTPLTGEEEKMLAGYEEAETMVEDAATEEAKSASAETVRDFLFSWKGALAGGFLLLLILYFIRNAGKATK